MRTYIQVVDVVRENCYPPLQQHLHTSGGASQSNGEYLVAANSIICALEYTEKLRAVVGDEFAENFASLTQMAEGAMGELQALEASFGEVASEAMKNVAEELSRAP